MSPFKHRTFHIALIFFLLVLSMALNVHAEDSMMVPYTLKGMNVYVYNDITNSEYYAGRVDGNYFSRDETKKKCRDLAYNVADEQKLSKWSYICCTVTLTSECATKVR